MSEITRYDYLQVNMERRVRGLRFWGGLFRIVGYGLFVVNMCIVPFAIAGAVIPIAAISTIGLVGVEETTALMGGVSLLVFIVAMIASLFPSMMFLIIANASLSFASHLELQYWIFRRLSHIGQKRSSQVVPDAHRYSVR